MTKKEVEDINTLKKSFYRFKKQIAVNSEIQYGFHPDIDLIYNNYFLISICLELCIKIFYLKQKLCLPKTHNKLCLPKTHNILRLFNNLDKDTQNFFIKIYNETKDNVKDIYKEVIGEFLDFEEVLKENEVIIKDYKYNVDYREKNSYIYPYFFMEKKLHVNHYYLYFFNKVEDGIKKF